MRRLVLLLFTLYLAAPAWEATYYVATSGGNNGNSCMAATNSTTAKQTIQAGMGCLVAGDTLSIRAGTYTENIDSNVYTIPSGTSWSNAITIAAAPGETVIIQGTINLVVTGCGDVIGTIRYLIFDRIILDGQGFRNHGFGGCGNGDSRDHIRFQNGIIRNYLHFGVVDGGGEGSEFLNNEVHNNGTAGLFDQGIYVFHHNIIVAGNHVHHNAAYGIHVQYDPCNNLNSCTANNVQVYNNRVHDNGYAGITVNHGDNMRVYNNLIYNHTVSDGWGLQVDRRANGTLVANNTLYNNLQGIQNFRATNTTIRNTILFQSGTIVNVDPGTYGAVTQSNTLTTSPSFTNPGAGDFTLQAVSAAINAGLTVAEVTTDFIGTPRPQPPGGAYDIGAYEFASGGSLGPASMHWKMNEGTGTSLADASGNGHTATLVSSPTWGPGRVGSFSVGFNGSTSYATVAAVNNQQYTWAMWIKGTADPGAAYSQPLMNGGSGTEPFGFSWGHADVVFRQAAQHQAASGAYYAAKIPTALVGGLWYHIGGTYDGSSLRVYLNGVLQATTGSVPAPIVPSGELRLGTAGTLANAFSGQIDDVRIDTRALSEAEMLFLYRSTAGTPRHRIVIR